MSHKEAKAFLEILDRLCFKYNLPFTDMKAMRQWARYMLPNTIHMVRLHEIGDFAKFIALHDSLDGEMYRGSKTSISHCRTILESRYTEQYNE